MIASREDEYWHNEVTALIDGIAPILKKVFDHAAGSMALSQVNYLEDDGDPKGIVIDLKIGVFLTPEDKCCVQHYMESMDAFSEPPQHSAKPN